jgi:probable rRNA maturation factor
MENRIYAPQVMPSSILHPPSSLHISIASRQRTRKINPRRLKQITEVLLADLKFGEAELGINLVSAREMTLLNETFLRHEGPTDVVTFDYSAEEKRKAESGKRKALHGEIFICVDEAISQSKKFKTSWQSEVARYLVHGVLHLLGHDDRRADDRRRMKQAENRWLRRLGRRFSLAQLGRAIKLAA